jgi:branched-chain amino acid transport system substrate-binding protein
MRIALLLLAALTLVGCSKAPDSKNQSGPSRLKVGLILPLTGDSAFYGKDALDTALLWKKDHPNAPIDLFVEDSPFDAMKALNASLKLTQVNKVNVLCTIDANTGRALSRVATKYKAIQFCQAWDKSIADRKYNVVYNIQPEDLVSCLFGYFQKQNIHKLGIIYYENTAFTIDVKQMREQSASHGIEIVTVDPFTPGVRDFRIELLKIKEKNPELLMVLSFSPEQEIIARQLKEIGWNIPISTTEMFDISSEKAFFNGSTYVSIMDLSGPFSKKFFAEYKRQTTYPGYTYDILTLVNNAYEKCGHNLDKLPAAVQSVSSFDGIIGVALNDKGTFRYQPFLVKMVDGMPERVKE